MSKINIENLVKCQNTGDVLTPAMQEWLSGISGRLRKRLETLGIIAENNNRHSYTVEEWVKNYIKSRTDVKDITIGKRQEIDFEHNQFAVHASKKEHQYR